MYLDAAFGLWAAASPRLRATRRDSNAPSTTAARTPTTTHAATSTSSCRWSNAPAWPVGSPWAT
ncbi:hypothetical protein [Frankia sp. AgB32]|uniref:hypothetical protein n=1 Tax=Frankia sp. AgB32 TaxID=631119 RepID=UPI00200F268B|nr:hypothetical protein [Frankia sp. AgB32]MCK9893675.1 hypothetical protein [Frankia sp. AgB32]